MRKPVPGLRYFECEECGQKWDYHTRDCKSPSGEHCPNLECQDFTSPCGNKPDEDTAND